MIVILSVVTLREAKSYEVEESFALQEILRLRSFIQASWAMLE